MSDNILYYGDNLDILRRYIKAESVDLIYLDPPFNSNQSYNILFAEQNGSRSAAQIKAFEDTWRWDQSVVAAWQNMVENGPPKVSQALQAFRMFLGENDVMAYLSMMAPRLVELRRVLKSTGSIYLHCDPTASHYLKILMDTIFGPKNFKNEIVWCYSRMAAKQKHFNRNHDIILWYSKGKKHTFNVDEVRLPYAERSKAREGYTKTSLGGGQPKSRRCELNPKGKFPEDWWQIPFIRPNARERLGYPTQKPETLLERIIKASSNEGDVVLDPFCGCGTTISVAQRLNRRWIGIDITHLAITLIKNRLRDTFGDKVEFDVIGEPVSLPDAKTLAKDDPYQFQWWALGLVGARPVEQKKGSDKGIDGRIYFHDEGTGGKTKQIILSVKSGHVGVGDVRDLRGVVDREKAAIGVLITLENPTRPMITEANSAGFYNSPGWNTRHPKLQILTIEELLAGKKIDSPPLRQVNRTFKKAPRAKEKESEQRELL